ncbi:MAG TPA: DUF72 domain-containing protein, partial [Solirubrobacterales bacterium]|nr:DUF72 domain-containing protein [Solirubrobacterales bacterium]
VRPVRIGCSGWQYASWRGRLYPEGLGKGRWLERYAEVFDTVEINATFYRLTKRDTAAAWAEQVPDGFVFAVKGSRYLTHMRRLREIADGVARFWEPLEPLREAKRLGPVLWQLPERFERDDDLLAAALDVLPPADNCFEFRHPSWFAGPVYELLAERDASLVLGDDARRPLPAASPVGPLAYLRFHYGSRGRAGNYSTSELDVWRRRIAAWRARRPVFASFHNDWRGVAPANARELRHGLSGVEERVASLVGGEV